MAASLCASMKGLSVVGATKVVAGNSTRVSLPSRTMGAQPLSFRSSMRTVVLTASTRVQTKAVGFFVEAKQNGEKRVRQDAGRKLRNKSRIHAIGTRTRKAIAAMDAAKVAGLKSESDLDAAVKKLISEAYQEIDKAVVKGAVKKNTGARRKSKLARYKTRTLIAAGLYTPTN